MRNAKFVLNTVGISLWLNSATAEERKWITAATNARELDAETDAKLSALIQRVSAQLAEAPIKTRRQMSAELNGLYGLYEDQLDRARQDVLYLVATDTAFGKAAAQVLKKFLHPYVAMVDSYVPPGLSTATRSQFADGMKALISWCEGCVPGYQTQGYRVVFNLTGAFKSRQGYLAIVGMFYADEMIYIFETGSHVLSIPRLPIQVDYAGLSKYSTQMEMMNAGHLFDSAAVTGIPDGMIETIMLDGIEHAGLSTWGTLIWNRTRKQALSSSLLVFPRLRYSKAFLDEFEHATKEDRIELQAQLAKASGLLEDSGGDLGALGGGGLQYTKADWAGLSPVE